MKVRLVGVNVDVVGSMHEIEFDFKVNYGPRQFQSQKQKKVNEAEDSNIYQYLS